MNVEIANKLVKLRKQMGLSQEELAEKVGVSRQAVSKWERSESSPDTDNLIALSRVYGLSIDEMLNAEKESSPSQESFKDNENEDKGFKAEANFEFDLSNIEGENVEDPFKQVKAAAPIMATIVFLALGLIWGLWHPGWLVFLLIPVIYFVLPVKVDGIWTIRPKLRKFPYPILATFIFLLLGFLFDGWAWAWLVFLTIPLWAIFMKKPSDDK